MYRCGVDKCAFQIVLTILIITFFSEGTEAEELPEIRGTYLNQPCDLELHESYIEPLYTAISREEYKTAFRALRQYLDDKPALESKSCFGYNHSKPNEAKPEHYRYLQCRPAPDQASPTCQCSEREPYLSQANNRGSCSVDAPSVGSACKRHRTNVLNHYFYDTFRANIDIAKKVEQVKYAVDALQTGFAEYRSKEFLHSDIRRACYYNNGVAGDLQNPNNFECSSDDTCVCVNYGKRFRYVPKQGGKDCEALKNSVCYFKLRGISGKDYTFVKVDCKDSGTECLDVPIKGIADWATLRACLPSPSPAPGREASSLTILGLLVLVARN
jgi:hypothetical protein